ncbi:hypothetical protein CS8_001250 [Cupriavidus sp. 8B]
MRLIIEARLADEGSDTGHDIDGILAVIERRDCSLADLGLPLAEGRSLLTKVQAELVSKQVEGWLPGQTHCRCCGASGNNIVTSPPGPPYPVWILAGFRIDKITSLYACRARSKVRPSASGCTRRAAADC